MSETGTPRETSPIPEHPRLIPLPQLKDARGNLTFVEAGKQVPFSFDRVYFLYDVPGGATRGGHAHRRLRQLIVPVAGSFDVCVDNGTSLELFQLNRAFVGLYLPPMHWRTLENFASGSVCLVIASDPFDESDYIRDHAAFLAADRIGRP